MNKQGIYICYLKALTKEEVDLINAYWEFNLEWGNFRYKTTNDMFKSDDTPIKHITNNIKKYSFISSKSLLSCISCGQVLQGVNSRSAFKKYIDSDGVNCEYCIGQAVNIEASDKILTIHKYYNRISSISSYPTDLDYIDSINIALIISGGFNRDTGGISSSQNLNLTGSVAHDEIILNDLIDKDAIRNPDDGSFPSLGDVLRAKNYLFENHSYLNAENYEAFKLFENAPNAIGMHLTRPQQYSDYNEYLQDISSTSLSRVIKYSDVRKIESSIKTVLLVKATKLALSVAEKYNFTIMLEDRNRLENTLLKGVMRFKIGVVYGALHTVTKSFVSKFYNKKNINKQTNSRKYIKSLQEYLKMLESKDESEIFVSNLPHHLYESKFEIFSCDNIFDSIINWDEMSGSEVLKLWIEQCEIED